LLASARLIIEKITELDAAMPADQAVGNIAPID
jgi:hypothetical protein